MLSFRRVNELAHLQGLGGPGSIVTSNKKRIAAYLNFKFIDSNGGDERLMRVVSDEYNCTNFECA